MKEVNVDARAWDSARRVDCGPVATSGPAANILFANHLTNEGLSAGPREPRSLFHALVRIPRALQFAHINDLPDVVGIVGSDGRDNGCFVSQRFLVGRLDRLFPVG